MNKDPQRCRKNDSERAQSDRGGKNDNNEKHKKEKYTTKSLLVFFYI